MVLNRGCKGEEVKELQTNLQALGLYKYGVDGKYGQGTQKAVVEFQRRYFVDGIVDSNTSYMIKEAVRAWKEGECMFVAPSGLTEINKMFGSFECNDTEGGRVEILGDWVERHIVEADLPVVGRHQVHKDVVKPLTAALNLVRDRGLDGLVEQFWCLTPRRKMWKPGRSLSTHSWGIAVDINWHKCPVGSVGTMDSGIYTAFEQCGWEWGGRWRTSDPMHYQFAKDY